MSSFSLSAIESLLRMTVATPVSAATFPIGSSLAACAGAGAAGAAGVCGAGACAGWVCASRIRPDVSSARAALPNVTQAKRQAKSESANDSLYDVTMDFRAEGTGGERERARDDFSLARLNAA